MKVYKIRDKKTGEFLGSGWWYNKWVNEEKGRLYHRMSHVTQSLQAKGLTYDDVELIQYELVRLPQ